MEKGDAIIKTGKDKNNVSKHPKIRRYLDADSLNEEIARNREKYIPAEQGCERLG